MSSKRKSTENSDCCCCPNGKIIKDTAERSGFDQNKLCNACFTSYDIAIDYVENLQCICTNTSKNNCSSCVLKKIVDLTEFIGTLEKFA